ncbi:hypothetical protein HOD29_02230 [archaeon]|nr:hypothetical protein [archaeon]
MIELRNVGLYNLVRGRGKFKNNDLFIVLNKMVEGLINTFLGTSFVIQLA